MIARVAPTDARVLDHRRVGHGQGARGGGDPRRQRAARPAVRARELRGDSARSRGERDVRPRARRVHRRDRSAHRTVRARAPRHAVSRRGRRPRRRGAGEAAARDRGEGDRARRRRKADPRRRAHRVGDEQGSGARAWRRHVSRGSALSAERDPDSDCRRCASGRATFRRWCATSRRCIACAPDSRAAVVERRRDRRADALPLAGQRARAREHRRAAGDPARRAGR